MAKPPEKRPPSGDVPALDSTDPVAQELARRLRSILPRENRDSVLAQVVSVVTEERFSGPIAHPKHLREYDEIVPGSGDRIICMAESQLEHAQRMQDKALSGDIQDVKDGRLYGFSALTLLIIGATICGVTGHEVLAGAFLGTGALGTIGAFIKGKSNGGSDA